MANSFIKFFKFIIMAKKIIIKALSESSVKVRNKVVYKNMENNWIACSELSEKETEAFLNYKDAVIDNLGVAKGTATYTFN